MEIILNKDMANLGYKGDIVSVKPGYARNYLIPQGIAVVANASNRKMIAELQKQQVNKIKKRVDDAKALASKIESSNLVLKVKTGTTTKIFGTVTTLQVAHALKNEGIEVDRRHISIPEPIKEIGSHKVLVECYKDIIATVTILVQSESQA